MCARASLLHSSHMSSRHNSVPEINVLSRLKFSKSVFPHLMLIWAKRNQLVLLKMQQHFAVVCLTRSTPPPSALSQCCCTPVYKLIIVLGEILTPSTPSSTPAPRLVYNRAPGLNTALQWCSRTEAMLSTVKAMPFPIQIQGVSKPILNNAEKPELPVSFQPGSVASEEKTWSASQDYSSP